MRPTLDLAPQRRQSDEPASIGDTVADVAKGIGLMLVIIAFGFDMIGFFS